MSSLQNFAPGTFHDLFDEFDFNVFNNTLSKVRASSGTDPLTAKARTLLKIKAICTNKRYTIALFMVICFLLYRFSTRKSLQFRLHVNIGPL